MRINRGTQLFPWTAEAGLRFELFLALWSLESPRAQRHRGWAKRARLALRAEGRAALGELGGAAEVWALAIDLPVVGPVNCTLAEVTDAIASQSALGFAETLLESALHEVSAARALIADNREPAKIIAALPAKKREWLAHIGLFPFDAGTPMGRTVTRLARDPAGQQQAMIAALNCFWRDVFAADWQVLRPQLERSAVQARRLISSSSWDALAPQLGHHLGLNIEVDSRRRELSALRGGYRLAFKDIARVHFMPSAFNEARFWTVLGGTGRKQRVYLPFFDPAITLEGESASSRSIPETDVALIFRALGDATRFAIAEAIARRPMQAVEIARLLGLSKPTITHHLHELRQAGLITERTESGAVLLGLAREAVAGLSTAAERRLFERMPGGELKRSRRS